MTPPRAAPSPLSRLALGLDAMRRRLERRRVRGAAIPLLSAAATLVLLLVVADAWLPGGVPGRMLPVLFAVGNGALLVTGAVWVVRCGTRRCGALHAARVVERAVGERHNAVINAVSLWRSQGETGLTRALAAQAEPCLRVAGGPTELRLPRSSAGVRWLLPVAGAWLAYVTLAPKSVLDSLARLVGLDRPPPTLVQIQRVRPAADDPVHARQALTFEFAIRGGPVEAVKLTIAPVDAGAAVAPRQFALSRARRDGVESRWSALLAPHEVTGDLRYECRAGDGRCEGVVRVLPQPAVVEWNILLSPPKHVGVPPTRVDAPDLLVWPGTDAEISFQANTQIADPVLVLQEPAEYRVRMAVPVDSLRQASAAVRLLRPGRYRVEFTDATGMRCDPSPWHTIAIREDAVPRVRRVEPVGTDVIDVDECPSLSAEAEDDLALTEIALVVAGRADAVEQRVPIPFSAGRIAQVAQATSAVTVAPGESVRAWFEARDTREDADGRPAPQVGRSDEFRLTRKRTPTDASVPQSDAEQSGRESSDSGNDAAAGAGDADRPEGVPAGSDARGPTEPASDASGNVDRRDGTGEGGAPKASDRAGPTGEATSADEEFMERHGESLRRMAQAISERGTRAGAQGDGPKSDVGDVAGGGRPPDGSAQTRHAGHGEPRRGNDQPATPPGSANSNGSAHAGGSAGSDVARPRPADDAGSRGGDRITSGERERDHADGRPVRAPGEAQKPTGAEARADGVPPDGAEPPPRGDAGPAGRGGQPRDGADAGAQSPHSAAGSESSEPGERASDAAPPDDARQGDASGPGASSVGAGQAPSAPAGAPAARDAHSGSASSPQSTGPTGPPAADRRTSPRADVPGGARTGDAQPRGAGPPSAPQGSRGTVESSAAQHDGTPESGDSGATSGSDAPPATPQGQGSQRTGDPGRATASGGAEESGTNRGEAEGRDPAPGSSRQGGPAAEPASEPPETSIGPRAVGPIDASGRPELRDTLNLLKRLGDVPADLAERAGWSPAQRAAFVRDLKRVIDAERGTAAPGGGAITREAPPSRASREAEPGAGVARPRAQPVAPRSAGSDDVRPIAPPSDQRVSPELRRVLDGYYRSMAQRRPQPP